MLIIVQYFTLPAHLLLWNYAMVILVTIFALRNALYIYAEKKRDKISGQTNFYILLVCLVAPIALIAITWGHWSAWLILVGHCGTAVGAWLRGKYGVHFMRIAQIFFISMLMINSIMFSNIIQIISDTIVLLSIGWFYIKFFKRRASVAKVPPATIDTPAPNPQT